MQEPRNRGVNVSSIIRLCIVMTLVILVCAGCSSRASELTPNSVEVSKIESPDRKLIAVVVESSGDATTSYLYQVFIKGLREPSQQGKMVAAIYGATRNPKAYGVDVSWQNTGELTIQYWQSQGVRSQVDKVEVNDVLVDVRLVSGVLNPSAPPGSMEYSNVHDTEK